MNLKQFSRGEIGAACAFIVCLLTAFLLFLHPDIGNTGGASLSWLAGDFKDFYELSRQRVGPHNYLPSTTWLFALWNLPGYFLGILGEPRLVKTAGALMWFKLLPALVAVVCAVLIYRVVRALGGEKRAGVEASLIWATSPLMLFGLFFFGQYDIFTATLSMAALLLLLRRRLYLAALIAGVAFSFKYFAVFCFVPMLLLYEKRITRLALCGMLFVAPALIELLPFISSEVFREDVFGFAAAGRAFAALNLGSVTVIPLLFAWGILCGIAFFDDTASPQERQRRALYYGMVGIAIPFSFVLFNPQWLVILTPWIALTSYMHHQSRRFMLLDIVMLGGFLGFVGIGFAGNVDFNMVHWGVAGDWTRPLPYRNMAAFFPSGNMWLYHTILNGCIWLNIWLKRPCAVHAENIPALRTYFSVFLCRAFVLFAFMFVGACIAYGWPPQSHAHTAPVAPAMMEPFKLLSVKEISSPREGRIALDLKPVMTVRTREGRGGALHVESTGMDPIMETAALPPCGENESCELRMVLTPENADTAQVFVSPIGQPWSDSRSHKIALDAKTTEIRMEWPHVSSGELKLRFDPATRSQGVEVHEIVLTRQRRPVD